MRKLFSVAMLAITTLSFAGVALAQSYDYGDYEYLTQRALDDADYASAAAAATTFGASLVFIWCCAIIIGFGIAFGIAFFVYKDAKKHNVANPALWGLLTFFTSLIGLLIYFLAIRPDAIKNQQASHAPQSDKKE